MAAPWGDNLHYVCTCTVPPYTTAPPRNSSDYCPVTWDGNEFSLIYIWAHANLPLPAHQAITTDQDVVSESVLHLLMRCPAVCVQAHVPRNADPPKHYQIFVRSNMVHEQMALQGYFEGQAALIRTLCHLKNAITIEPHRVQHWSKPPVGIIPSSSPVRNETVVPWQRQLRPSQIAAVEWMQSLELSHGIQLRYDPRIPITSDVAIDTARGVTMSTLGMLPDVKTAKCRIGVLSGERGVGKTSAILGLAMSVACNTPLSELDAYEYACLTPCKATLIIIPRHLLTTWKMEIAACCPNANVLYLCDTVGHANNSASDLDSVLNAHIVVSTARYLRRHNTHNFMLPLLPDDASSDDISMHPHYFIKQLLRVRPHRACMQNLPLDLFKWRRVVVDETFENQSKVPLNADFYWCLGADADKVHVSKLIYGIQCAAGGSQDKGWSASAAATFSAYCTYTIRRQETASHGAAVMIDTTRYVQLLPVESMRYEAALSANWAKDRLIKLCCGLTPDQPGQFMTPTTLTNILARAQDTHEATVRALPADLVPAELLAHRRFEEMANRIAAEPPEECPVCYMNNSTLVTTCGHTFCWTCMFRVFCDDLDAPCPICRRLLGKQRDVYQHLTSTESPHGAKVAALIALLNEIPEHESCVIFVAWHSIAHALSAVIPGSKVMTNKTSESTLVSFSKSPVLSPSMIVEDEPPVRILILTFQQCHGLSLTRANHAILYHPPLSQSDEDSAISCVQREGQERAVHIHRLVVNGAVECEIFS